MEVANNDSPDWSGVVNGPALPVILKHLNRRSTCNLRLTCSMLGDMDFLKDKCFGVLRVWICRRPENDDLYYYQAKESTYIRLDDQVSFEALGRLAPFVKQMTVRNAEPQGLTDNQQLAPMQPLPLFPKVRSLEWDWRCIRYDPNPETLLALARLTPAVVQVSLAPDWALIPGPFHADLLSLWPQLKDVRVRGCMDERLCGRQANPHTLLNAAASNELLTEIDLRWWWCHPNRRFDLSALFHNNRTPLRVLGLRHGTDTGHDLIALTRLDTLEKLFLSNIRDQSGHGIVTRDFLMALASVTTLKELGLADRVWNCTAMDLVHWFRDAQFSLRSLNLFKPPFTAALPQAIADTQKDLEKVWFWQPDFAEGEPTTVNIRVLKGLPKMKKVECTP